MNREIKFESTPDLAALFAGEGLWISSFSEESGDSKSSSVKSGDSTSDASEALRQLRILVVEDHADIRNIMKSLFEREGYSVAVAANGQEGLDYLKRNTADLVVLDLMMPVMDGFEFSSRLRDTPNAGVPLVVVSAMRASKEKLLSLGAKAFIKKPLDIYELLDTVQKFALK